MTIGLAAIEAREKKATKKPWKWHKGDSHYAYPMVYAGEHEFTVLDVGYQDHPGRDEDAEFVAHARADIPRLIAEVKRLERIAHLATIIAKGLGINDYGHYELATDSDPAIIELLKEVHDD